MIPLSIERLIDEFSRFPGIGRKTAQRMAFYVLKSPNDYSERLSQSIIDIKTKIRFCKICNGITEINPCSICDDVKRDQSSICVIEDVSDLWTFERIGFYKGMYHVLGGLLSAINGIGANDLAINKLLNRIHKNNIDEVVLALSTTLEGQTTSHIISEKLELVKNIKVTRLAEGVPIGGEVHYLDENTLHAAYQSRKKIV